MALDTFETLLSLGAGFASGASKRRRDNELIELDIKQKEQTARINRISSIEKSLLTLFNTEQFSAESMMAALQSVPQLVDDERSSFSLLEKKPVSISDDPSKRELFEQRKLQFEETQERLTSNEEFDRNEAIRKAKIKAEQDAIDAQTVADKAKFAKQKEIGDSLEREIRDIDARISGNNKLLKDEDTPVEDLREANRRNVDLRRQRTALTLQRRKLRDSLKSPITKKNIRSKVDVFKKMIQNGLMTRSDAVFAIGERLKKQVASGRISIEEAERLTFKFRDLIFGSK